MPTYLKDKYIFFFISISGRIRILNIFPAEPDPDQGKKCLILIPDFGIIFLFSKCAFSNSENEQKCHVEVYDNFIFFFLQMYELCKNFNVNMFFFASSYPA